MSVNSIVTTPSGGGSSAPGAASDAILSQDRALQLLQLRRRLEPELLVQSPARARVRLERVGLAPTAIQREHQQSDQPLTRRMLGGQLLELADDQRRLARGQPHVEALLERDEAQLLQPRDLPLRERLERRIGQRGPAPQRQRVVEQAPSRRGRHPHAPPARARRAPRSAARRSRRPRRPGDSRTPASPPAPRPARASAAAARPSPAGCASPRPGAPPARAPPPPPRPRPDAARAPPADTTARAAFPRGTRSTSPSERGSSGPRIAISRPMPDSTLTASIADAAPYRARLPADQRTVLLPVRPRHLSEVKLRSQMRVAGFCTPRTSAEEMAGKYPTCTGRWERARAPYDSPAPTSSPAPPAV